MKSRFSCPALFAAAGLIGLSPWAAADDVEAPAVVAAEPDVESATDRSAGFLGVAVAESVAPPQAGADVPRTVLLVSRVMPGSPADDAGLRSGDVLLELDGQQLLHPVQLSRLVAHHSPGHAATLTVLRDGETQTLQATLGERPADVAQPGPRPFGEFDRVPLEMPEGFGQPADPMGLQLDFEQMQQRMDQQFEQMRRMFREGMNDGWPGGEMWERGDPIELDLNMDLDAMPGGQQVTVLQDHEHKLTVTQNAEGRHLLATDLQGNVLFDGPIDTPAQITAVPAELRDKLPEPGQNRIDLFRNFGPRDFFRPRELEPRLDPPADNDEPGEQLAPAGRAV